MGRVRDVLCPIWAPHATRADMVRFSGGGGRRRPSFGCHTVSEFCVEPRLEKCSTVNVVNVEWIGRVEDSTYAGLRAVHGNASSCPSPMVGETLLEVTAAVTVPEGCGPWWTVFHQL